MVLPQEQEDHATRSHASSCAASHAALRRVRRGDAAMRHHAQQVTQPCAQQLSTAYHHHVCSLSPIPKPAPCITTSEHNFSKLTARRLVSSGKSWRQMLYTSNTTTTPSSSKVITARWLASSEKNRRQMLYRFLHW